MGTFPNPEGRPLKDIDLEKLEELAMYHNSVGDAANELGLSKPTMIEKLKDPKIKKIWDKGRSKGRIRLRESQFKLAFSGNVPMQIWLGKQYLDQSDQNKTIADHTAMILQFINAAKDGFIPLKDDGSEE